MTGRSPAGEVAISQGDDQMNKALCVAVAPIIFLASCASVEKVAANGSGPATYYCTKTRLQAQGENLVCNWEASARDACRSSNLASLEKSAVASGPNEASRCETGDWLIAVTTR
jgi:hypothetical protein